jgi:hypothetical protein
VAYRALANTLATAARRWFWTVFEKFTYIISFFPRRETLHHFLLETMAGKEVALSLQTHDY